MSKQNTTLRSILICLICRELLMLASSASAQLTVTTSNQHGTANTYPFVPTWTVNTNSSLIAGLVPATTFGNFDLENPQDGARSVNTLTLNTNLAVIKTTITNTASGTTEKNYVTCGNGSGAGNQIIYSLPGSANGYNLTNITYYGGWADNGRDALAFTVLYSTVANPADFVVLTSVNYNPSVPGSTPSANQAIINDAAGGVIASNVAALEFVYDVPNVENGYAGVSAITVGGTPASVVVPALLVGVTTQTGANPFTPSFTAETPNLIANMLPTTANGNFTQEGAGGVSVLTDGSIGTSGTVSGFATCGANGGTTLVYTLTNGVYGSDVTNIVVYSGWGDGGRDGQYYILSYSTVSAPTTYIPITTVHCLPLGTSGAVANRVAISKSDGSPLAGGVANIKFDFSSPTSAGGFNNGYQGYSEIIIQGTNTATPPPPPSPYLISDVLPIRAETFVGDQVVFTAAFSNSPPVAFQWQQITTGPAATNNINAGVVNVTNNGVVTSTLTLNNVQLSSAGSYVLEGLNATNGSAAPSFSSAAPLAVTVAGTVGNVVTENSGQEGAYPFYPVWSINTNADLIFGSTNYSDGSGNFATESGLNPGDPGVILADGTISNAKSNMVSCGWVQVGVGQSVTYTLPTSTYGYDLTNITVYGGWPDDGRNEQKYQVLYSTEANPSSFVSIGTFDYNPSFGDAMPNATRVSLVPASGFLARNVAAVQINFNQQSKNNWNGYSEITVGGTPSAGTIPPLIQDISPVTAEDVVGGQLIMTAAFTNVTGYQWQKNGVNLTGQTSSNLVLNSLQLSDTATNGGYRLLAYNAFGTNMSRGCSVVVDPTPAATNNVVASFAIQTSDANANGVFSPTWDTSMLGTSLIAGQNPPSIGYGPGNFNDPDNNPASGNHAGGLPVLTDGNYGFFNVDGTHPAFATCGNLGASAGQYVVYSLGANANGYTITNIQIAGGWNDDGRDSQYYTVSYSTVSNPQIFYPIAFISKDLSSYGVADLTAIRTTLTPAAGVLASNAYAIMVDFTYPYGVANAYSGYSEISVFGPPTATAGPVVPQITVQHEETNNTWTAESPNLIHLQFPSSQGPGVFTGEGCSITNLTDGVLGFGFQYCTALGDNTNNSVSWIVFNSASGWNLTNIVTYTLWHDYGRDGQFYNLSYSTLAAPATFLLLASVSYNPFVPADGRASGNRVQIAPPAGQTYLATNVAAVKFDFTPQGGQDFSWSGYSEIVLQGANLGAPAILPTTFSKPLITGGNMILAGSGGAPAGYHYTWLSTTNLTSPVVWITNITGNLDGTGSFSNSIPVGTNPAAFFRFQMP